MKKSILLFNVFLLFMFIESINAQGPWAKGKKHGYSQLLFNIVPTYSELFDKNSDTGKRTTERELSDITIVPYIELGVSDKLTIGGSIPFVFVGSGDASSSDIVPVYPEDNLNSLGNISVFGKYTFIDKNWKLAFIADFELPTSTRNSESGLSTGVDAFTFQPKLSLGSSKGKFYYYGFFGYGLRTNEYNDFLSFGVEGGYNISEKTKLILNVNRFHNLNNGSDEVDSIANIETGFYTSFQEYTAFLIKVFAEDVYKDIGLFGSIGGGFSSDSVAASPALSLGVFYEW